MASTRSPTWKGKPSRIGVYNRHARQLHSAFVYAWYRSAGHITRVATLTRREVDDDLGMFMMGGEL